MRRPKGSNRPVLGDVARAAGVSIGTVSNIMNCGNALSYTPETQERVMGAAARLGYTPFRAAQMMRSQQTRVIGFASSNISSDGMLDNYLSMPFSVGLNLRLAKDGYHVAITELGELEISDRGLELPPALRKQYFDGLVVHYGLSDHARRFAASVGIPVVWWDSGIFEPTRCVYREETEVGRRVTLELIKAGHRNISLMVGDRSWATYSAGRPIHFSYGKRLESYTATMREHDLPVSFLVGYEPGDIARQMKKEGTTAAILFGANGFITLVQASGLLGWSIPEQLTVATCDREQRIHPGGTALGGMLYDRLNAGSLAAEMILAMVRGEEEAPQSVKYVGDWTDGDTVAAPRR